MIELRFTRAAFFFLHLSALGSTGSARAEMVFLDTLSFSFFFCFLLLD